MAQRRIFFFWVRPGADREPEGSTTYEKLNVIDVKCAGLLQLTSVLLVFLSLSYVQTELLSNHRALNHGLLLTLLLSCVLQLAILGYHEEPPLGLVRWRKRIFNVAVCLTGIACGVVFVLVGTVLLRA